MEALPFLLKLIDDPSPSVQEKVAAKLRELGPAVWNEIQERNLSLTESQTAALSKALASTDESTLRREWKLLQSLEGDLQFLEEGLLLLAEWQTGPDSRERGRQLLDEMASEYLTREPYPTAATLAQFLFDEKGLQGAPSDDYYNPLNSNLTYSLISRQGLPITLSAIFILIGSRAGLSIEGCNFPGHFLTRDDSTGLLFDPYNGGRILPEGEVAALYKAAPGAMQEPATGQEIVARVLRNLCMAYHQEGETIKAGLMLSLAREIEEN